MNAYITVDSLKGTACLNIMGTAYDTELRLIAESVSRQIDTYCNRKFYTYTGTLTFDGDGSTELFVPELVSITSLKEDSNSDGTFDTTWASKDYILQPQNAQPTAEWGRPYTRIQVSFKTGATQDVFLRDQQNYQVVGTFGFRHVTTNSQWVCSVSNATAVDMTVRNWIWGDLNNNGTWDSDDVTLLADYLSSGTFGSSTLSTSDFIIRADVNQDGTITVTDGQALLKLIMYGNHTSAIEIGQTLLIGTEQVYVTATAGTAMTVRRGLNGSTGTAYTNAQMLIIKYPETIREAAKIQTARLWHRKDSAYSNIVGMPETGQLVVSTGLDNDVKQLLTTYKKPAMGYPT